FSERPSSRLAQKQTRMALRDCVPGWDLPLGFGHVSHVGSKQVLRAMWIRLSGFCRLLRLPAGSLGKPDQTSQHHSKWPQADRLHIVWPLSVDFIGPAFEYFLRALRPFGGHGTCRPGGHWSGVFARK